MSIKNKNTHTKNKSLVSLTSFEEMILLYHLVNIIKANRQYHQGMRFPSAFYGRSKTQLS